MSKVARRLPTWNEKVANLLNVRDLEVRKVGNLNTTARVMNMIARRQQTLEEKVANLPKIRDLEIRKVGNLKATF